MRARGPRGQCACGKQAFRLPSTPCVPCLGLVHMLTPMPGLLTRVFLYLSPLLTSWCCLRNGGMETSDRRSPWMVSSNRRPSSSSSPRRMPSSLLVGGVPAEPWQPDRGGTTWQRTRAMTFTQLCLWSPSGWSWSSLGRQAENAHIILLLIVTLTYPPFIPLHTSTGKDGATQQRHPQPALPQGLAEPCQDMV